MASAIACRRLRRDHITNDPSGLSTVMVSIGAFVVSGVGSVAVLVAILHIRFGVLFGNVNGVIDDTSKPKTQRFL